MSDATLNAIPGGPELLQWFGGRAPSFHDAEVLGLSLDREKASATVRVHAFEMTSDVDSNGFFACKRHVVVTLKLSGITGMELDGFNHQNVLDSLRLNRTDDEYKMELDSIYGLGGYICAVQAEISIKPGIPAGSQYLRLAGGEGPPIA